MLWTCNMMVKSVTHGGEIKGDWEELSERGHL